jgi:hypothetical protein
MYGILEQRVDQARHTAGPKAYCNSRLRASINQLGASMQASSRYRPESLFGQCASLGQDCVEVVTEMPDFTPNFRHISADTQLPRTAPCR